MDGQLLISAQVTSARANALYGAAALDMPRRGVAHARGGTGAIAVALADAVTRHGGRVLYRRLVTRVRADRGGGMIVEAEKGGDLAADVVLFNLPPWDAAVLVGEAAPADLRRQRLPDDGWGAFMLYAGLPSSAIPAGCPLHHQVLLRAPLGEGNSVPHTTPGWRRGSSSGSWPTWVYRATSSPM